MASGGTHHSGKVRIKAPMAKMTDINVHTRPCQIDPPRLSANSGKRLEPTIVTKVGVIIKETAKSDMIMTTGVTATMMINGAKTAFKFKRPMRSNQVEPQPSTGLNSIQLRTELTARSQYKAPRPVTMTAIKISGSRESKTTLG